MVSNKESMWKNMFRSFSGITTQKICTENDKQFHPFPNNVELIEIINDKKLNISKTEMSSVLNDIDEIYNIARNNTLKYSKLLEEARKLPLKEPKLLVEVISGHDILLSKSKKMPFVEVIQNANSLMKSFRNSLSYNQTFGTEQIDSFNTSIGPKVRSSYSQKNSLVLSTQIPIQVNEEGIYEWHRFFQLVYDPTCIEKERSITVNLFRTRKDKNKWDQLGKSKTFFLNHMRDQEMKEMTLEYREGYDSTWNGIVNLRLQYVHNERVLFEELTKKYQEQQELISKFILSLEGMSKDQRKTKPESSQIEDSGHSQKAGFYSYLDDDSYLGNSNNESPEKSKIMIQNKLTDELSYEISNSYLIPKENNEEEKNRNNLILSLRPEWSV